MTKDQLLEKIKKLLALSNSSNPHEAATALLRAQKLMEKYNIEKESLIDDDISFIEVTPIKGLKAININRDIGAIISKAFGVETIYVSNKRSLEKIMFFGAKDILESCEYIYVILSRAFLFAKNNHAIGVKTEAFFQICDLPKKEINRLLRLDEIEKSDFDILETKIKDIIDCNLNQALEGNSIAISNMKTADKMIDTFLGNYSVIDMYIKKYVEQSKKGFVAGFLYSIYNNVAQYKIDEQTKGRILKAVDQYFHGATVKTSKSRGYSISSDAEYNAYQKGIKSGSSVSICTAIKNRAKERLLLTNES